MRIVSGSRGGRLLKAPHGRSTRPTPDRVREALFSILGDRVPGARFLDLFAGTGANGLEALSRGAENAVFVESARAALSVLRENIARLEFDDRCVVVARPLPGALSRLKESSPFDLVFADPPYASTHLADLLASPGWSGLLATDAVVVAEAGRTSPGVWPGWVTLSVRDYGDTRLFFLSPQPTSH